MFEVFSTFTVIITINGKMIVETITSPIMFVVPRLLIKFFIISGFWCSLFATLQIYKAFTFWAN